MKRRRACEAVTIDAFVARQLVDQVCERSSPKDTFQRRRQLARLRGVSRVFRDTIPIVQPSRFRTLYSMVRAHSLFSSHEFTDIRLRKYVLLASLCCGRRACMPTHLYHNVCPRLLRDHLLTVWSALYRSQNAVWSVRQCVYALRRYLYVPIHVRDYSDADWIALERRLFAEVQQHRQQALKTGLEHV